MKHLKRLLLTISLVLIVLPVNAETLEVFLYHRDKKGLNIKDVEKQHTIQYYYLDTIKILERDLSDQINKLYQQQFNAFFKSMGMKKVLALSDTERMQYLSKFMKERGINLQIRAKQLIAKESEKTQKAISELSYAEDQGVNFKKLPTVIYKGVVYAKTRDLVAVVRKGGSRDQ